MSPEDRRCRVAVLISGNGSNLQAIIDATGDGRINTDIVVVISDQPDAYGLTRARQAGIETRVVRRSAYETRERWNDALAETVAGFRPDLVVLAGFMKILDRSFVERYEQRILNIHPSLLPAFKGLDTHRRVIESGESRHGASVHFVTAELDEGPVVVQRGFDIEPEDTVQALVEKVHRIEHEIYPEAIGLFADGRLRIERGRVRILDRGDP